MAANRSIAPRMSAHGDVLPAGPMNGSSPPARGLTVLVVDDYEDNRQMYAELLAYAGFSVVEACNGAEGIVSAQLVLPDLVIMDLSLPVIDGWEATRRLKRDERTKHIPILALTGHAPEGLAGHSRSVEEAGCDGFLAKPCSPDELLEMVETVLDRGRRTRHHAASASIPLAGTRRASGG
jgi:two-component system cell cycle response regulator DivK